MRIKKWAHSNWNKLDIVVIVSFFAGSLAFKTAFIRTSPVKKFYFNRKSFVPKRTPSLA